MKVVFIGGGAHRLVGVIRSVMAMDGVLAGGEVNLYDLDVPRAEAVGRMLMKAPEFAGLDLRITWGTSLDEALDGADAVGVVLMTSSQKSYRLGRLASRDHGFLDSDNVSANGSFLAIKGGRLLMDIARRMEEHCPDALLMDFANPVAVFSAMINRHTKIQTLGVCEGFKNHLWDLTRMIDGRDTLSPDIQADCVGVNHLSFIVRGQMHGQDLFEALDRKLAAGWSTPALDPSWPQATKVNIGRGIKRLVWLYETLGVLVFSTESDGMEHLLPYDELVEQFQQTTAGLTATDIEQEIAATRQQRSEADATFRGWLDRETDEAFWSSAGPVPAVRRQEEDVFVRILTALATGRRQRIATSRLNHGAIEAIKDDTVVEYTQTIQGRTIEPVEPAAIPEQVHGITAALATFQTLLGDAIVAEDPKLLAQALLSYPVKAYTRAARDLYRDLLRINAQEIPAELRAAEEFLR